MSEKHGGALLVRRLEALGVERVFLTPGESYLAALDALYDSPIETIVARQEGGAAMMAEADGKLTGRPGVCLVTRGPGATNAAAGVHVARQDSTPMLLLVGQIGRAMRGRDAFQEVDYRQMFGGGAEGGLAKWVEQIDDAERIPEVLSHAFHVARNGRPGPVVLALPEDMLSGPAPDAAPGGRVEPAESAPTGAQIAALAALLEKAERPIAVLGGARWDDQAVAQMRGFAERWGLPVACSFRRQGLFDNEHPNYAGDLGLGANPALVARIKASDLLLAIGAPLSENPSQNFTLLGIPEPGVPLVHVLSGPEELGRIYRPDLAICATPGAFLEAALTIAPSGERPAPAAEHAAYRAWSTPPETPADIEGVDLGAVVALLNESAPEALVTNGAGNYAAWLHRYRRHRDRLAQLGPISGSMGYGLPAAIAAKLRFPEREVICFAGDGCFQMTGQEFGTAAQYGANVIVLLADNARYGTIEMHQRRRYPERPSGTALRNPDFAALARAYGGYAETVAETETFPAAFERARKAGKPALLHLLVDRRAISPSWRV